MKRNILFTGYPRCGKSTLIEKIVKKLGRPATGFFTREIRENDQRTGFSINTLDGQGGLLAHKDMKGRHRLGKYVVNTEDIDRIAVPSMIPKRANEIVVIDEIGKMECFSPLFRNTLINILDSNHPVIGSISLTGNRFINEIKAREDVLVVRVTEKNRDELAENYVNRYV